MRKWGRIGSPFSAKRRRWLSRIARKPKHSWRSRGYKSKRAYLMDRARHARYRPARRYRRGRGNRGDWARRRCRR